MTKSFETLEGTARAWLRRLFIYLIRPARTKHPVTGKNPIPSAKILMPKLIHSSSHGKKLVHIISKQT